MLITGVWLTTRSNYKKNHLFFKSWSWSSIKVQPIFEPLEAALVLKQSNLDFVFVEDEFLDLAGSAFPMKSLEIQTPWVIKMCSNEPSKLKKNDAVYFYKSIVRPLIQVNFEELLSQIITYKKDCMLRDKLDSKRLFTVPDTEDTTIVPVIKIKNLCYIRKKSDGTLVQFDNGVLYNYKTSFETFFKLTQSHSNIFEVTPGLLVNLDKLQNIIPDEEEDEFVCNLVSQKNIEISKAQKESLIAHIENYS